MYFFFRENEKIYIFPIYRYEKIYIGLIFLIILSIPVSLLRCLYFIVLINVHTVKEGTILISG